MDRELAEARERGGIFEEKAFRRREFLQRMAAMAGAAGAAGMIPPTSLLNMAAKKQAVALTDPNSPIEHVVILMMENRSFDHYFGWLPQELANASQNETYLDPNGNPVGTLHFWDLNNDSSSYQGCGHPDPGHGWGSGRRQLQDGFMAQGSGNDEFALTYFNQDELGFIHAAAKAYTVYDNYFTSALTSTWPNRYYKWSGTAGGRQGNSPPAETLGNQWDTIFDVGIAAGLTCNYYASDLPFAAVWGARGVSWTRPSVQYFVDCAAGTLPNITIIDPPFRDGGGFDGNSADEHPHGDVRLGQAFMSDVAHAFMESPCYQKGALFIIYDEWGGFYDHVTPPVVPDDRATSDLATNWGQLGFRTPAVCISPWTRNKTSQLARVGHGQYAHESILRLAANKWNLGDLNLRHKTTNDIGESFNWIEPDFEPADLPDPTHIVSQPCSFGGGDLMEQESKDAHAGDMDALEDLALRHGFKIYDSTPEQLFREPVGVRQAYRAPGK